MAVSGPYTLEDRRVAAALRGYLSGGRTDQPIRALIYADDGNGAPGRFVAASGQVTIAAGAAPAWVTSPWTARLRCRRASTGSDTGSAARASRSTTTPSRTPAGTPSLVLGGRGPARHLHRRPASDLDFSLYATLGSAAAGSGPANTTPPQISGGGGGGADTGRLDRQLERQPDRLRVPVAALRRRRRLLRRHRRRLEPLLPGQDADVGPRSRSR